MEEESIPPIKAALSVFMQHYIPAPTQEEADELMSTSDIADYLSDLISLEQVDNSTIFGILKENGYKFGFTTGFTWFLQVNK